MPKITEIKSQKRSGRFNIYLDGKFGFALSAEALVKTGLKVDQEISSKKLKKLIFKNEFEKLYNKTLRFLSFRPRSEKEIHDYLKKKVYKLPALIRDRSRDSGRPGEIRKNLVSKVIEKLKNQNLIDDRAFAIWWCQQRSQFRPRSKRMILVELFQKGINKELADQVVQKQIDEKKSARTVGLKKLKLLQSRRLSHQELRQKLTQYLSRQGFNWSLIREVIDSLLEKE